MKVLIACEESQTVCKAFRALLWRSSGEVISDEMPMYERLPAQDC